jgi:DNA-binding MarR family transcriptional regulator
MTQYVDASKILAMRNDCACLQARRQARSLTKAYDTMLAPAGLKLTQFSTIAVLLAGPLSITKLADALELDRTTLSRNLVPLEKKGYLNLTESEDARERQVTLTLAGTKAAHAAYELWQQAQALYATPSEV